MKNKKNAWFLFERCSIVWVWQNSGKQKETRTTFFKTGLSSFVPFLAPTFSFPTCSMHKPHRKHNIQANSTVTTLCFQHKYQFHMFRSSNVGTKGSKTRTRQLRIPRAAWGNFFPHSVTKKKDRTRQGFQMDFNQQISGLQIRKKIQRNLYYIEHENSNLGKSTPTRHTCTK